MGYLGGSIRYPGKLKEWDIWVDLLDIQVNKRDFSSIWLDLLDT